MAFSLHYVFALIVALFQTPIPFYLKIS